MNTATGRDKHSALLHMASQLTLAWVALYTRGVPAEHRDRRQAELASDVWEHACNREGEHDTAWKRALQMSGRLISGIPADLMWRMELISLNHSSTASRRPVMFRSTTDKLHLSVIVVFAFIAVANGVGIAFEDDLSNAGLWAIGFIFPALVVLSGLVALQRAHPRLGGALIVIGAVGNVGMYFWMWPIMLVISGFIIWFGVTRARRAIDSTRVLPANAS